MVNLVCVTGGASVGKTSTLKELSHKYTVVPEAATDIILERELHPANDFDEFQELVTSSQLDRERRTILGVRKGRPTTKHGVILCDRGLYDGYAFAKILERRPFVVQPCSTMPRYPLTFLLEPLDFYEDNGIRFENNLEFTKRVTPILEEVYKAEGSVVIRVAPDTLEKRVEFIDKYLTDIYGS